MSQEKETTDTNENKESEESMEQETQNQRGASQTVPSKDEKEKPSLPPWSTFLKTASVKDIYSRFSAQTKSTFKQFGDLEHRYYILGIMDLKGSIGQWALDRVFLALNEHNSGKEKDILLILLSKGGSIEPAYQISKLCKSFAKSKFVVSVPRQAKSAATLLAIGADEIHMGPLGQLGPIDPQLGGLPALGVSQALESIASLSQKFPGSSDMLARYLRQALTVEQIGYCERISESAVQYAERLLLTKPELQGVPHDIAHTLVHEYKDHSFVIDFEEAKEHLGEKWILSGTPEIAASESVYELFDLINLFLGFEQSRRLFVIGDFLSGALIWDVPS